MYLDDGQKITYFGGLGVAANSIASQSNTSAVVDQQTISLLKMPLIVELTVGDITTLCGLALVVTRLAFDIYKYRQERKNKRESR